LRKEEKPYVDYKFLGVKSFIESLDEAGLEYHLFEEDDYSPLFNSSLDILKEGDSVVSGILKRDEEKVFFSQFALKITRSYRASMVFIFDHHPTGDDLISILEELEEIIMNNLDDINIGDIADKMKKLGEKDDEKPG
jgi:hypothetical protein